MPAASGWGASSSVLAFAAVGRVVPLPFAPDTPHASFPNNYRYVGFRHTFERGGHAAPVMHGRPAMILSTAQRSRTRRARLASPRLASGSPTQGDNNELGDCSNSTDTNIVADTTPNGGEGGNNDDLSNDEGASGRSGGRLATGIERGVSAPCPGGRVVAETSSSPSSTPLSSSPLSSPSSLPSSMPSSPSSAPSSYSSLPLSPSSTPLSSPSSTPFNNDAGSRRERAIAPTSSPPPRPTTTTTTTTTTALPRTPVTTPAPVRQQKKSGGSRGVDVGAGDRAKTGRLRFKWGIDVDLQVPVFLESLVRGPWDPQGEIWRDQVDMAVEVIRRSGGVVFAEQLAPVLDPRDGPSTWEEEGVLPDEAFVVRLLAELSGVPEVTDGGDILYIFPLLARRRDGEGSERSKEAYGAEESSARPEILQFEEVPGILESLPKIPEEGPKAVANFFQRAALSGFAIFISISLLLGQLFFGAWPLWLLAGPTYLVWIAADDSLRRSRTSCACERDRWRGTWADACRGDGDVVWRKRAAARLRARRLCDNGM